MSSEKIIKRDQDFSKWYTSIINQADLIDYSLVKGAIVFKPYAWTIWKNIESFVDIEFKKMNIEDCCFPLLIPLSEFQKEKEHIEGFSPELFTINSIGDSKIDSPLVLRPTSEILFCHFFKNNVVSYKDLPMMLNQWCNVFRAEKNTRPFLRTSEFFWQEQHSVFRKQEEAEKFAYEMLEVYKKLFREILCIPVIEGRKTEREKFAGAVFTLTVESIMQDGQALQCGTSHYLGQNFSRNFDMKYQNDNNQFDFMEQTSAGISTRVIGALIMTHSDDNGLVLPSKIAPIQIRINTLKFDSNEKVKKTVNKLKIMLKSFKTLFDLSDNGMGSKCSNGEVKGVPLQINIGPNSLERDSIEIYNRFTKQKKLVAISKISSSFFKKELDEYDKSLYQRALKNLESKIADATTVDQLVKNVNDKKVAFCYWDGSSEDEADIKKKHGITSRCVVEQKQPGKCIVTGKMTKNKVYFARAY